MPGGAMPSTPGRFDAESLAGLHPQQGLGRYRAGMARADDHIAPGSSWLPARQPVGTCPSPVPDQRHVGGNPELDLADDPVSAGVPPSSSGSPADGIAPDAERI